MATCSVTTKITNPVVNANECIGVLITNLGTPDSSQVSDVRRYLKEFLWDKRVVEISRPVWWIVLNLILLNTRPRKSAQAYRKIWTERGSPLLTISEDQATALRKRLGLTNRIEIALAMRYGNPSIQTGLESLWKKNARKILVLPLYPQYSATTTASTYDAVSHVLRGWRTLPELRFVNHYHDHPLYIAALAASVRKHWDTHGKPEKLIMSFHGIPQAYHEAGDPYCEQCRTTGQLLAKSLSLQETAWVVSFQSRLGPKQWLTPYTDLTLEKLAQNGIRRVQVICPGFSADCLETLEEIAIENKNGFIQAGGKEYSYIPCLNTNDDHIELLVGLLRQHLGGWHLVTDQKETVFTPDQPLKFITPRSSVVC